MAEMNKALYTAKELAEASENRRRISQLSPVGILIEWDEVTRAICRNCGIKRKDM